MPKVSVIVPNYNHANYLRQRIDSVLHQTFQDFELILLDDCSTDDSIEILNTYSNHPKVKHLVVNEANSGSTFKQWNKGLDLAQGEYIWIAESDDYAEPDFLERLIAKFVSPNVVLAYSRTLASEEGRPDYIYAWGEGMMPHLWKTDQSFDGKSFIGDFLRFRNVIPNASAVVFRKDACEINDEIKSMRFAGDWFLWNNIVAKGCVSYVSKPLNHFRIHSNTTRSVKEYSKEAKRIKEYFVVIRNVDLLLASRLDNFDSRYDWILSEWIHRYKSFSLRKSLFPPYPPLFLLRFYYECFFAPGVLYTKIKLLGLKNKLIKQ